VILLRVQIEIATSAGEVAAAVATMTAATVGHHSYHQQSLTAFVLSLVREIHPRRVLRRLDAALAMVVDVKILPNASSHFGLKQRLQEVPRSH
jgi:hypothetical protein